jgi:hypothetical protein
MKVSKKALAGEARIVIEHKYIRRLCDDNQSCHFECLGSVCAAPYEVKTACESYDKDNDRPGFQSCKPSAEKRWVWLVSNTPVFVGEKD